MGLGAKATPQSRIGASTDPIEKRLRAKLEAGKKRAAKKLEEESNPNPSKKYNEQDSNEDDEETESRTNAFTKKRPAFLSPSLQAKKKRK